MIKAVLFDFFGVIFSYTYWDLVGGHEKNQAVFRDIRDQVNTGQIQWPEFIQQLAKIMDKSVSEINQLYRVESLDPRMIHYIHKLHKTCKVALVTNASDYFIQGMLDRAKIRELFDEVVVSSTMGYVKPDPRMYSYTLERLGVSPNQAIMVDDNPVNTKSAERLGMHAVVYKDFDQFAKTMSATGVLS